MSLKYYIGLDVGAVSVQLAAIPENNDSLPVISIIPESKLFSIVSMPGTSDFILSKSIRHKGEPFKSIQSLLSEFTSLFGQSAVKTLMITGAGGKSILESKSNYINEFRAAAEGVGWLYPDVNTIFEMGGEHAKYIRIQHNENAIQILDYETNGDCAAGTGSFFDQQVERLHFSIDEVGEVVEKAERAAVIAGRCSVFAKTDMIHAQQCGYKPEEILKGLCEAVVRNFKGTITKGKMLSPKIALIGGMAANRGIVEAFHEIFKLSADDLFVPEYFENLGAIGAARISQKRNGSADQPEFDIQSIQESSVPYPINKKISLDKVQRLQADVSSVTIPPGHIIDAYLGIDIGSVSTNVALIDENGSLLHGIYTRTKGRPIQVVTEALKETGNLFGDKVRILGVATTGSGRELIGLLVGADVVKDEITAHKTGAMHISRTCLDRQVDTIFEIGGQDSKFISIKDGVVIDFALNEACAAGTGSFLEEQAKQLDISIINEFSKLALSSDQPLRLGERCTVFMEKELVPYLHRGLSKEEITAGLALSIVQNYLNRVVKKRPIGEVVFFQGGTAYNDAVAAAFSTILDKEIIVPPHNGIMGAIGAALIAKEKRASRHFESTGFRGWNLDEVPWNFREFTCNGCSNQCTVQEFKIAGEKSYWGDKCSDRYRSRTKTIRQAEIIDLHEIRNALMQRGPKAIKLSDRLKHRIIGLPSALSFHDKLIFWRIYLESLGCDVVISPQTNQKIVSDGLEATVAEPCFPIQVAHGHIQYLKAQQVDAIFFPHIVNEKMPEGYPASFICPWAQTVSLVALHSPALNRKEIPILNPTVHFEFGFEMAKRDLMRDLADWDIPEKMHHEALQRAFEAYETYQKDLAQTAKPVIEEIRYKNLKGIILIGRPYNLYDSGLNLNLPAKLRDLYGVNVLPMDMLPIDEIPIQEINDHMFWNYGRKIIQTAKWSRNFPNLHIIYLSNFKCGPDSYVRHYIEEAAGEPFLFLQLDSHSRDAGVLTRVEAFLESKGML